MYLNNIIINLIMFVQSIFFVCVFTCAYHLRIEIGLLVFFVRFTMNKLKQTDDLKRNRLSLIEIKVVIIIQSASLWTRRLFVIEAFVRGANDHKEKLNL